MSFVSPHPHTWGEMLSFWKNKGVLLAVVALRVDQIQSEAGPPPRGACEPDSYRASLCGSLLWTGQLEAHSAET